MESAGTTACVCPFCSALACGRSLAPQPEQMDLGLSHGKPLEPILMDLWQKELAPRYGPSVKRVS